MALTINTVVTVLVVWALCVTAWMMVLSTRKTCEGRLVLHHPADHPSGLLFEDAATPIMAVHTASVTGDSLGPHQPRTRSSVKVSSPSTTTSADALTTVDPVVQKKLMYYYSKILHRPDMEELHMGKQVEETCTLVVMTYKRATILSKVLNHYCKISFLEKILIIWNDPEQWVSPMLRSWTRRCSRKLVFIEAKANKLTNRYVPREEIKTDCVALFDDDALITVYDLQFTFEVWMNFRHLLVGFNENSFIENSGGNFTYMLHKKRTFLGTKGKSQTKGKNGIQIINGVRIMRVGNKTYNLGKAHGTEGLPGLDEPSGYSIMQAPCFIHKAYLEMYFDPVLVPAAAVSYVDDLQNCEDILLSIVVTKFVQDMSLTQLGTLVTKPTLSMKMLEKDAINNGSPPKLSSKPSYLAERAECLKIFSKLYGYLPLEPSNTIATLV